MMNCPQCGNEQSDGWLSCQKCHIIFSRWQQSSADGPGPQPGSEPSAPSPAAEAPQAPRTGRMYENQPPGGALYTEQAQAASVRRSTAWPVYLALILPLLAGLWLLFNPIGRKVAPGSYRDKQNHFAIRVPEGWLTLSRDNYDSIIREYGHRLPANLTQAMSGKGVAVSFFSLGQPGDFSPSFNVLIVNRQPPPIDQKSKLEAAKAIAGGFSTLLPDYQQESVNVIKVDKLRSLEIVSTASLPIRSSELGGGFSSLPLRFRQVLVPGKGMAYILTFTDTQDAGEDSARSFAEALDSFRVLKRPPYFRPVVNDGMIGGLIGAIFFLLNGLIRSLGGKREG
jgi:hypothetical protein